MILEFQPIKLGNRTIKVRKWKVRDRNNFKEELKKEQGDGAELRALYRTLLFNVLETPTALNRDERDYLFLLLRCENLGDTVDFAYNCNKCNKTVDVKLKIKSLWKTKFGEVKDISVDNISLKFQDVQNVEFYNEKISNPDSSELDDLTLHVKSFNGDETLGYEQLMEKFNDLEISTMDKIFDEYEKFNFQITTKIHEVTCPHCKNKEKFDFQEIPNIIPYKWLTR